MTVPSLSNENNLLANLVLWFLEQIEENLRTSSQNESFPIWSNSYKRRFPFSYNPYSRPIYTCWRIFYFGEYYLNSRIVGWYFSLACLHITTIWKGTTLDNLKKIPPWTKNRQCNHPRPNFYQTIMQKT